MGAARRGAGMGAQGYVGSSHDAARVRRQQEARERERAEFEAAQARSQAAVQAGGLRTFTGNASSEALEQAFRAETVGLVTREQFAEKRASIQERMQEQERERRAAEVFPLSHAPRLPCW